MPSGPHRREHPRVRPRVGGQRQVRVAEATGQYDGCGGLRLLGHETPFALRPRRDRLRRKHNGGGPSRRHDVLVAPGAKMGAMSTKTGYAPTHPLTGSEIARHHWDEITRLGLEGNVAELETKGLTVIPPDKVNAPGLAERLLDAILRVAEERTGVTPRPRTRHERRGGASSARRSDCSCTTCCSRTRPFRRRSSTRRRWPWPRYLLGESCIISNCLAGVKGPGSRRPGFALRQCDDPRALPGLCASMQCHVGVDRLHARRRPAGLRSRQPPFRSTPQSRGRTRPGGAGRVRGRIDHLLARQHLARCGRPPQSRVAGEPDRGHDAAPTCDRKSHIEKTSRRRSWLTTPSGSPSSSASTSITDGRRRPGPRPAGSLAWRKPHVRLKGWNLQKRLFQPIDLPSC